MWSQERKGGRVLTTVEPFGSLTAKVRKAVVAEAGRLGEAVEVVWAG
nr:hypothetical protein GCM10017745_24990 [Saccharothrix mutabilis subsp. capreolus]